MDIVSNLNLLVHFIISSGGINRAVYGEDSTNVDLSQYISIWK